LNQAEFRCKWLRLEDIWDCAEEVRTRYWSAEKLPVDVEAIVEFKWLLAISCGLLILIKSDSNENYAYHLEPFMPVNLQPIMGLQ